jgi:hypothetical protein
VRREMDRAHRYPSAYDLFVGAGARGWRGRSRGEVDGARRSRRVSLGWRLGGLGGGLVGSRDCRLSLVLRSRFSSSCRWRLRLLSLSGGSRRTATVTALRCMSGTTARTATLMVESGRNSSGRVKRSCSEPIGPMLSLCGGSSLTTAETSAPENGSTASTAPRSATSQRIAARTSFDRRTRLLIASGLICGITPTSMRRGSGQGILGFVSVRPAGDDAAERAAD